MNYMSSEKSMTIHLLGRWKRYYYKERVISPYHIAKVKSYILKTIFVHICILNAFFPAS